MGQVFIVLELISPVIVNPYLNNCHWKHYQVKFDQDFSLHCTPFNQTEAINDHVAVYQRCKTCKVFFSSVQENN